MPIVCIVQARTGSTRLPAKVLKPLLGKPMLWWVINRLQASRQIDQLMVATTTNRADDRLVRLCKQEGWAVYRGSEQDVLDRYYQAAQQAGADHIVRVTSDCPLIDPVVTDFIIAAYLGTAPRPDYASNIVLRTYPRGLDVEVFSSAVLKAAWEKDTSNWREHVTPYIYQNPEEFHLRHVVNPTDYSHLRWTVDTPEDYSLIQTIYEHFGQGDFTWQQVLTAIEANPAWVSINRDIQQRHL